MFRILCPGVGDVLQRYGRVEAETGRYGFEAFGAEGSLCVNVDGFALSSAFGDGHLGCYAEGVAQLCFASSELTEYFSDTSRFNALQ